jgi:hypothetical protein
MREESKLDDSFLTLRPNWSANTIAPDIPLFKSTQPSTLCNNCNITSAAQNCFQPCNSLHKFHQHILHHLPWLRFEFCVIYHFKVNSWWLLWYQTNNQEPLY